MRKLRRVFLLANCGQRDKPAIHRNSARLPLAKQTF
jgi:hypothetical protein